MLTRQSTKEKMSSSRFLCIRLLCVCVRRFVLGFQSVERVNTQLELSPPVFLIYSSKFPIWKNKIGSNFAEKQGLRKSPLGPHTNTRNTFRDLQSNHLESKWNGCYFQNNALNHQRRNHGRKNLFCKKRPREMGIGDAVVNDDGLTWYTIGRERNIRIKS